MSLSNDEVKRYLRHLSLAEVGMEGQKKLKQSSVLCVGAGGLGSPVLLYLAAAGIGTLGIVDEDKVDITNLQRQVLFDSTDIGIRKTQKAKEKLSKLNPNIEIIIYPEKLTEKNVFNLFPYYDVIVDCTDNFATRYLINDACFHFKKPNVFACISRFKGQCTIFCAESGPCYRCLFPAPPIEQAPNCAEAGVLGVLPGLLGSIQATEVIKLVLGIGQSLVNRLLMIDALDMSFQEFTLQRNKDCFLCGHKVSFHQLHKTQAEDQKEEIDVQELRRLKDQENIFILDVREPYEYKICNLGGYLIPLSELSNRLNEIPTNKKIVVHCQKGGRSRQAIELLQAAGFKNVLNLKTSVLD